MKATPVAVDVAGVAVVATAEVASDVAGVTVVSTDVASEVALTLPLLVAKVDVVCTVNVEIVDVV